jgi:hypothetical protein
VHHIVALRGKLELGKELVLHVEGVDATDQDGHVNIENTHKKKLKNSVNHRPLCSTRCAPVMPN